MKTNVLILFILVFVGCTAKESYKTMSDETASIALEMSGEVDSDKSIMQTQPAKDVISTQNIEKKIIKTANVSIEVENYAEAKQKIEQIIRQHNAYISGENENNYQSAIENNLIIRVPAEQFDTLINKLTAVAKTVNAKTIEVQDVTEEFIDKTARLNNKKEVEKRYVELLKKANAIKEIIEVEEQLRVIREEIESTEGRLKYLNSQVSLSTVNLRVFQSIDGGGDPAYSSALVKAMKNGWSGLVIFSLVMVNLWPLIVATIVIWLLIRTYLRRKKAKT